MSIPLKFTEKFKIEMTVCKSYKRKGIFAKKICKMSKDCLIAESGLLGCDGVFWNCPFCGKIYLRYSSANSCNCMTTEDKLKERDKKEEV